MLDNHEVTVAPGVRYNMGGIFSYARGLFRRGDLDGSETSYKVFHKVVPGQIVLSQLKGWEGAIALACKADDSLYLPPHNLCFRTNESIADSRFVFWFLKQRKVWEHFRTNARGMGARRDTVSVEVFLDTKLSLPPLSDQRRIVAQLDAAAALIAKRKAAAGAVELEVASTLAAAFARVIDGVPRATIAEVAPLTRRPVEIDPEGYYPEIGVRSFGRGLFMKPTLTGSELTWQKLFVIREGDLVFSNIKAWEGAFAVARKDHDGKVGSHRYLTCVPDSGKATADFLWYFLESGAGLDQIQAASPGSADRNRTLSQTGLESITVPLPPLEHQRWFDKLQSKVANARDRSSAAATELERLIPSMLDQLF